MKNKKLFQKIVLIALAIAVLIALVAPAIFSQTLTAPRQEKLLNGLKVLMWPDAKADKVSVKLRIHAGSAFDPQGKEGVMQLLSDNLFPNEASREFFTEDLGGSLEIITNYDFIQINASSKPEEFLSMLETISSAVSNPQIDKETTVKLRNALLARVAALEADPAYVADQAVAKRLFGTFPYGRPQNGTAATLQKLDFADLIDAKGRFLTADNATLILSGNFERATGYKAIRRYFGGWLKSDRRVPTTFRQPDEPLAAVLTVMSPKPTTSAARFAIRGTARSDKELAASMIFSSVLQSRLRTRAATSHEHEVSVRNFNHTLPGIIVVELPPKQNNDGTAVISPEASQFLLKSIVDPITASEFQLAKSSVQVEWAKKDPYSFWLDADTFKIANLDAHIRIVESVTFAEVTAYAERARKLPVASVLVNTPPAAN